MENRNELHVLHSWGGGITRWASDFCTSSAAHNWHLKSFGKGWQNGRFLQLDGPQFHQKIRNDPVIRAFSSNHSGYKIQMETWHQNIQFSRIYISSLIGHDLSLFNLGVPVTYVIHDFFPFCTTLDGVKDGPCQVCDKSTFISCLKIQPEQHKFGPLPLNWFRELDRLRTWLSMDHVSLVAPSHFAAKLWPKITGIKKEVRVIPHGVSLEKARLWHPPTEKPRVLILGALTESKGLNNYRKIMSSLHNKVDFYLLGCGPEARSVFSWAKLVKMRYRHDELRSLISQIQPTCALQLSPRAETFGYVVAELKSFCIPAIIPKSHAFTELMPAGQGAIHTDLKVSPAELWKIINATDWQTQSEYLAQMENRPTEAMQEDYRQLMHGPAKVQKGQTDEAHSQNFLANLVDLGAGMLWKKNFMKLARFLSRLSRLLGLKVSGMGPFREK